MRVRPCSRRCSCSRRPGQGCSQLLVGTVPPSVPRSVQPGPPVQAKARAPPADLVGPGVIPLSLMPVASLVGRKTMMSVIIQGCAAAGRGESQNAVATPIPRHERPLRTPSIHSFSSRRSPSSELGALYMTGRRGAERSSAQRPPSSGLIFRAQRRERLLLVIRHIGERQHSMPSALRVLAADCDKIIACWSRWRSGPGARTRPAEPKARR